MRFKCHAQYRVYDRIQKPVLRTVFRTIGVNSLFSKYSSSGLLMMLKGPCLIYRSLPSELKNFSNCMQIHLLQSSNTNFLHITSNFAYC